MSHQADHCCGRWGRLPPRWRQRGQMGLLECPTGCWPRVWSAGSCATTAAIPLPKSCRSGAGELIATPMPAPATRVGFRATVMPSTMSPGSKCLSKIFAPAWSHTAPAKPGHGRSNERPAYSAVLLAQDGTPVGSDLIDAGAPLDRQTAAGAPATAAPCVYRCPAQPRGMPPGPGEGVVIRRPDGRSSFSGSCGGAGFAGAAPG